VAASGNKFLWAKPSLWHVQTTTMYNHFMALCLEYPGELVPEETFTHSHLSWS